MAILQLGHGKAKRSAALKKLSPSDTKHIFNEARKLSHSNDVSVNVRLSNGASVTVQTTQITPSISRT